MGSRDQRGGIWITAPGSGITSHGIGIRDFLSDQGSSSCIIFAGTGTTLLELRIRNLGTKMGSAMKKYTCLTPYDVAGMLSAFENHAQAFSLPSCSFFSKGTTWAREILWQIYHDGATSDVNIKKRVFFLESTPLLPRGSLGSIPVIDRLPSPRLMFSHLPYHVIPKGKDNNSTCKYIYVARNPKDVVVSFYHFMFSTRRLHGEDLSSLTWDTFVDLFLQGKRECSFLENTNRDAQTNLRIFSWRRVPRKISGEGMRPLLFLSTNFISL